MEDDGTEAKLDPRSFRMDVESVGLHGGSVFICYAHSDNSSHDPRMRWLDRFLEFLRPLVRQDGVLKLWSDKDIETGDSWHSLIQGQLRHATAGVLLVSPAFLASDYIARSEVTVLLKNSADDGMKVLPLIISPCLYEETRFKYPDWMTGPHVLSLGSLQSVNPPSRTLIEMSEGEQNRVLLAAARQLSKWLEEERDRRALVEAERAMEAKRARTEREEERKRRVAVALAKFEGELEHVKTRHHFENGICSRCGSSAQAVAHFGWFRCDGK